MITLYQFPISHFCEKVRWALHYRSIPHRYHNLLPGFHAKTIQELRLPSKRNSVPVIQDGQTNVVIQGSKSILDYLEEEYQLGLGSHDASEQAKITYWEQRLDADLGPAVRTYIYNVLLNYPDVMRQIFSHGLPLHKKALMYMVAKPMMGKVRQYGQINHQTALAAHRSLLEIIEDLNQRYEASDYLVGDAFSRADLTAAALLAPFWRIRGYGMKWPSPMPSRFVNMAGEIQSLTPWVARLYRDHRGNPV